MRCDAGVVREGNGNGFVTVFWPDGGNRVLYFEDGTIARYDEAEADGAAKLTVTRSGDVQTVTVGRARFQIVDALACRRVSYTLRVVGLGKLHTLAEKVDV